tara:strand:- start:883 stop:2304 length:1422 start_codon:yes stop_codon:yes gene_type:complete
MEALEKDFQDLVASEEQEILDAVEPIQEEPVAEEDTEEILEEEEEITAEELEAFKELIAELKKENPDIDFDNVDIVISEDGEVEVYEEKFAKGSTPQSRRNARLRYKANKVKIKLQRKQRANKPIDKEKSKRMKKAFALLKHFDPSDVASDDAVAIGEEQQDVQEYTAGVQKRPVNVLVWRTIGGELKKVKRWTSKGKKGINKGPKSAAHKTAISKAMLRAWKPGGAARKAAGKAEESVDYIDALGNGETLSETFKDKAKVIFESAVNTEVESVLNTLEEEVHAIFDEEYQTAVNEMTTKVDSYMAYVVEGWMEENKMTIESGIRADIAEDFMSGLKKLFTENYITVPEEKVDVVEELATKVKVLEEKLNQEVTANIEYKKELSEHKQSDILTSLTSDLTFNDQEKLREVAKGVIFENESDYTEKIQTLKESYFPKEEKEQESALLTEDTEPTFEQSSGSMDVYTQAIARSIK